MGLAEVKSKGVPSTFTRLPVGMNCGVVSNICVLSNAVLLKAALPETELLVDARATASNDDAINKKALDVLQGVQVKILRS